MGLWNSLFGRDEIEIEEKQEMKEEEQTINEEGLNLIKECEGFRNHAYLDSVKIPTCGFGTTHYPNGKAVQLGDTVTMEQATEYLRYDIRDAEKAIRKYVTVSLTSNQFSALVSWVYNLGAGALRSSDMLRHINTQEFQEAAIELKKWHHAGGKELPGLVIRRNKEAVLFLKED